VIEREGWPLGGFVRGRAVGCEGGVERICAVRGGAGFVLPRGSAMAVGRVIGCCGHLRHSRVSKS